MKHTIGIMTYIGNLILNAGILSFLSVGSLWIGWFGSFSSIQTINPTLPLPSATPSMLPSATNTLIIPQAIPPAATTQNLFLGMDNDTFKTVAMFISAIAGLASAFLSLYALRTSRAIQKLSHTQSKGSILFESLQKYLFIKRGLREAQAKRSIDACEDYFREMMDLLWFEYHLWKQDLIDDLYMHAWLIARYRSYNGEKIVVKETKKGTITRTCSDYWNNNKNSYFPTEDEFITFLDQIHAVDSTKEWQKRIGEIMLEFKSKKPYNFPQALSEKKE